MRWLALVLLLTPIGAASAQAPKITIEDDVAHANVIKCVALRTAQLQAHTNAKTTPTPRLKAAIAAWQAYMKANPGFDPAKVKAEVESTMGPWTSAANPAQAMAATEKDCLPFEIEAP